MIDVLNLALPYFGLISLGYFLGKLKKLPEIGLAWMNFFILYVALPALFYRIVAETPFEQSWVYAAVLMAALPPALNVFVLARQCETWVEHASSSVLFGTMASDTDRGDVAGQERAAAARSVALRWL
jgi:predicted permease